MRTQKEMMDLILNVAQQDNRIRAVCMNGSRVNPNVTKDPFQDYDIVFLVTDMNAFIKNEDWIDIFGERIILQTPENMSLFPPELGGRFSYLMLFTDGNRIDLTLVPFEEKDQYCQEDSLTVILLDKDGQLPTLPSPSDIKYRISQPSEQFFADCWNEFWWVSTSIAKGLWREEVPYVYEHLMIARKMLHVMLGWQIGIQTNFSTNIGKAGRYLQKFLSEEDWQSYLQTFPQPSDRKIWKSLFQMIELFQKHAKIVAKTFHFSYPHEEANRVLQYLTYVKELPADAEKLEIYKSS